jgi:hypothetical protein
MALLKNTRQHLSGHRRDAGTLLSQASVSAMSAKVQEFLGSYHPGIESQCTTYWEFEARRHSATCNQFILPHFK